MAMQQQMYLQPALPTPNKKWYGEHSLPLLLSLRKSYRLTTFGVDHLADKLMGDDPSMSAQTKYALVCGGCFRHNGLVGGGKEEWEKTSASRVLHAGVKRRARRADPDCFCLRFIPTFRRMDLPS